MRPIILLIVALTVTAFGPGDEVAKKSGDELAKADLLFAHQQMVKATEVLVYRLGKEATGGLPAEARTFPIEPYKTSHIITAEQVLRGDELKRLRAGWAVLAEQDQYVQGLCHFPVYGLSFRDANGQVLFQTSLCWACKNYYVRSGDGYRWASMPKQFLPQSEFRKQLDELFKPKQ